jgi:RNA polymerase sigma factor (sigma-70 family)
MGATPEQLLEQTLVIRSQLGDEAAFSDLLGINGPRLLRFTERMMSNCPDQIADVMQDTWIAIYRSLPKLRDVTKFRPWAFRIARDRIFREYRRLQVEMQPLDLVDVDELPSKTESVSPPDLSGLEHLLSSISPEHREALVLRFQEDLTYEEIAQVTGASIGTIRSRIYYGKRALRIALEGKGL